MINSLPPGSVLMLGALVVPMLRGRALQAWILLVPVLSFLHLIGMPDGTITHTVVLGQELTPVRVDKLSLVWGYVFHLAAFGSAVFSLHVKDRVQQFAALGYAGSAIAAVFAGDLVTLFIWWELTAVTSVFLIWARRTERSFKVGTRYLIIQVLSGVLLLAGLVYWTVIGGNSIAFNHIGWDGSAGATLILLAFGIKAAFPFLHMWLEDAYPEATVTGTVWLSAFTTKLAIYALARGFAGTDFLIYVGAAMTAFPIFFAVIENDLRRVLAYSLNNQLGYMVVGIGIGTEMALNGTAAHAFAHIIYKGLLFMAMGAVMYRVGTTKGSELGGLYKSMPWTTVFCIIGGISISGFPLTSGFISKSIIVSQAGDIHNTLVYLALLFASAGVFHHSGIKIPYFAFFAHDNGHRVKEAPTHMLVAMGILSVLCIALGVYPQMLYSILPYPVDYQPYTASHVIHQMQLLMGAALAFAVLNKVGAYPPELRSTVLDFDWTYRKLAPTIVRGLRGWITTQYRRGWGLVNQGVVWVSGRIEHSAGLGGGLSRTSTTGTAVMTVGVFLSLYMILYFGADLG